MRHLFSIFSIVLVIQISGTAQSLDSINSPFISDSLQSTSAFSFEASYTGDFVGNLTGGKKTGTVFLGMANLKIGFETKNVGLWEGGEFFVNGASTHGGLPSQDLFGDFQVASNIEAGDLTYLHELWYRHTIDNFQLTIGLQDLNAEFVTSEFAGYFINSSFGIPSVIADNIPVPIFPLTALGIATRYDITDKLAFQAAIFDGLPEDFENNRYNLNWDLDNGDGALVISELHFATDFGNMPGKIKAGYYYHSHLRELSNETGIEETIFNNNYGFYLIADQTIYRSYGSRQVGLFAQLALSPSNINVHNYYLGGGINYHGIFNNESENSLGLAFAHAGFNNSGLKGETTIEMFYQANITDNLTLQPDIQYIINPAGSEENYNDALAVFMRFGINF